MQLLWLLILLALGARLAFWVTGALLEWRVGCLTGRFNRTARALEELPLAPAVLEAKLFKLRADFEGQKQKLLFWQRLARRGFGGARSMDSRSVLC